MNLMTPLSTLQMHFELYCSFSVGLFLRPVPEAFAFGMQTAVSRVEVTVINHCHVVARFTQPSVCRQCLGLHEDLFVRQAFKLLMIELYESSHILLKPLPRGFFGACLHERDRWYPPKHTLCLPP